MTFQEFKASLNNQHPPTNLPKLLLALWHDGKGDWEAAHEIAQEANTPAHCWIHAYLHRKEGDDWNAAYWYKRASRPIPTCSLDEEWASIVKTFLQDQAAQ